MTNIQISKFLSQILRHKPGKIGLTLDKNGWANVAELLEKSAAAGMTIDTETLQQVIDTNDKKRYALSEDGLRIRANQGHSIKIDLELTPQTPPEILYHGTGEQSVKTILHGGILPMRRMHVHLSKDAETALKVGKRHGKPVILTIKTGEMAQSGYKFYLSENGVWLTDAVPAEFIERP